MRYGSLSQQLVAICYAVPRLLLCSTQPEFFLDFFTSIYGKILDVELLNAANFMALASSLIARYGEPIVIREEGLFKTFQRTATPAWNVCL